MTDEVYCPFSGDGRCTGQCPSNRERMCVNGEPATQEPGDDH